MSAALGIVLAPKGAHLEAKITPPDPVPVARLVLGRPPEEVAALMGHIFNLCGVAQGLAVRLSLGLPIAPLDARREILRDHLAKLCLHLPRALGLAPQPLPEGWAAGGAALQSWIWGGAPPADLEAFLASGRGVAPLLTAFTKAFAPGEAVADLPPLTDPMQLTAQENSPAGRVAAHPLMAQAEAGFGRGPLWRVLGRALDLHAVAEAVPEPELRADGTALVAAARGTYALRARAVAGVVTALARVTPTDHLIAPGGALSLSLATLPAAKIGLAALVIDSLDPCVPVSVKEVRHA